MNPAVSGIDNYIDVKSGYRKQWAGLDGAPTTQYFSVSLPLGEEFLYSNANSFSEKGSNPANRSFLQDYQASEPHHGIGVTFVNDRAGYFKQTDFNFTYAYHLGLGAQLNLSTGVSAGFTSIGLDQSQLTLANENDPALSSNTGSQLKPDVGVGVWLYGANYFVGLSAKQILSQQLNFGTSGIGKQAPHYFASAGMKFFVGDRFIAMPSVMVKHVSPVPVTYDLNMKLAYSDKFWVGGSYRKNDSFAALLGVNLGHLFTASYSYDFTTSKRTISGGTHEFVLGILLNNRYRVPGFARQF